MSTPLRASNQVTRLVARGQSRLRTRRIVRGLVLGAWVGASALLLIAALSRLWWFSVLVPPLAVAVLLLLAATAAGAVAGAAWPGLSNREVALLLDRAFQTDERLVTAMHLVEAAPSHGRDDLLSELDAWFDALPASAARLPIRPPRRTPALVGLAVVGLLVFVIPQRPGAIASAGPPTAVQSEGQRLAERLAELEEEYDVELPEHVEQEVERLAADLMGDRLTPDEAVERLDELREQLERMSDDLSDDGALLEHLEQAARQLSATRALDGLSDAIEKGDLSAAARAARELEQTLEATAPEEKQRMAEALQRAGQQLAKDPQLQQAGEALQQAGNELQRQAQGGSQGEGGEQGGEGGQQGGEGGQQGGEQGGDGGQQGGDGGQQGGEGGQQGGEGGQQGGGQQGGQQAGEGGQQGGEGGQQAGGQQGGEGGEQGGEGGQQGGEGGQQAGGQQGGQQAGGQQGGQQAGGQQSGQQAGGQQGGQQAGGQQGGQQAGGQQGGQQGGEQGGQQAGAQQGGQQAGGQQGGQQGGGQQGGQQAGGQQGGQQPGAMEQLARELERNKDLAERLGRDQEALAKAQRMNGALEAASVGLGGAQDAASGQSSQPGGPGQGGAGAKPGPGVGTGHTWEDQGTHDQTIGHQDADRNSAREGGAEVDDFQEIYDPERLQGIQALLAGADGQLDASGRMDELPTRLTGGDERAGAARIRLPADYRQAADEALSAERVPPGYRDAVKNYFDGME